MTPSTKVLTDSDALRERERLRTQGKRVGFTNGCFDIIHAGHVRYLTEARAQVDALFVGLNDDGSVRALKGSGRPVVPLGERMEVLAALEPVSFVVPFGDRTAERLVELLRPDVYFKGADYSPDRNEPPEARIVRGYGAEARYVRLQPGISTTNIVERIRATDRE